jgi:hypothetical protein
MAKPRCSGIDAAQLREQVAYDPETGEFRWLTNRGKKIKAGAIAGGRHPCGQWQIRFGADSFQAHRLAWLYVHGEWPPALIDHINGNRLDNRLANLRAADHRLNAENRRVACRPGDRLIGASFDRASGRYIAQIGHAGKNMHLGRFSTKEEAHDVYIAAKRELHAGCTL